jgi:hypothetical protein
MFVYDLLLQVVDAVVVQFLVNVNHDIARIHVSLPLRVFLYFAASVATVMKVADIPGNNQAKKWGYSQHSGTGSPSGRVGQYKARLQAK